MKALSPRILIFLTVFIDLLGFGIVLPIASRIADDYVTGSEASRKMQIGILMASYSLCQMVFAPMWGRLSDRVGRRPIILLSLTGSVISYAIFGLSNSFMMLLVGRAFAGICGANLTAAQAYIADVTEPEKRTSAMGLIGMAFGMGFALGPVFGAGCSLLGKKITPSVPDQMYPGLTAAAICFINLIWSARSLPESLPRERRGLGLTVSRLAPLRETLGSLSHRTIGPLVSVFFLSTLAFSNLEVSLGLYTKKEGALLLTVEQLYIIFIYVGLVLAVVNGWAVRKMVKFIPESILVIMGTLSMAIALVMFPLVPSMAWIYFTMTILAFGQGICVPALLGLVSQAASAQNQGQTMGITQSASSLARIIGPIFAMTFWMFEGKAKHLSELPPTWPFFAGGVIMIFAVVMAVVTRQRLLRRPIVEVGDAATSN